MVYRIWLQPIAKLYFICNRTKITGWFPVLQLKYVLSHSAPEQPYASYGFSAEMVDLYVAWRKGLRGAWSVERAKNYSYILAA